MDMEELKVNIFYFFREKFYTSALNASKEGIGKFKGNSCFHLFHALALVSNNHIEEGIQVLESIISENDIKLSVIIALMYSNKLLGVSNKEVYFKLDAQMKETRKVAEPIDFFYSGFVLFALNKLEKSLDYLDKALTLQSGLLECWTLKGWVLLELKKSGKKSVAIISEVFLQSLQSRPNLDSFLGLGEAYLYENNYEEAQSVANKTVVRYPNMDLPLLLKLKVQLAMQEWDHIDETLSRILTLNNNSLDALRTLILITICRDANYNEAIKSIKKFMSVFDCIEPKNGPFLLETAKLFSEVCEGNADVLQETYTMMEEAARNFPDNANFFCELGFHCLIQNEIKGASRFFKSALKIEHSSTKALIGSIIVDLEQNGVSEQLKEKIEHLLDIKGAQNSSITMLLKAKMSETEEEAISCLNKASDYHLNPLKHYPYSVSFLKYLNPHFMLQLAKEYLKYIPFVSDFTYTIKPRTPSAVAIAVENILTILHKACSGMVEPLFLLAKIQYHLIGDVNNATANLEILLKKDNLPSEAYLLMAQIQICNGTYERASQILEEGLSIDFKLRENPIYHFINGIIQKRMNTLQESIKSLTTAISIISEKQSKDSKLQAYNIDINEKAAIFIELIDAHNQIGQVDEAMKLLEEATEELQKTPEESRIVLLCAEQAVNHNNIQGALELLGKVDSSDPYYSQARTRFANILLEFRKDKHAYLDCYLEMVSENACIETYMLLGDAYMTVLEPDLAIETYQKALKENPRDPYINQKMGETLVFAHYFHKAVDFYKEAIELTNHADLKLQLAHLYMQMREFIKAEHLLISEIEVESTNNIDDLNFLQYKTKLLNLLATIQEKAGNKAGALITLKDARDNQNRVKKRLAIELPRVPQSEIDILVSIYTKLAEMSIQNKDNDEAINYYKEACEVQPENVSILGALAKLYIQMNALELCQQTCGTILDIDSENEEASLLMADIAFHKVDFDMALFHFTQLLAKQPTNWNALVRLVEVMRRTGNLEDLPEYLNNAENMCENPLKEGGLLYSKALYQWYAGNLNSALRNFNITRQDLDWGLDSIYNMIEICLNPEDDMLTDQLMDNDDLEYRDSRSMALKTADRLLKELKQKLGESVLKYKLMLNFRLLATKEKPLVEQGLEAFIALASQNVYKDNIGVILGMSTAYTLLKQSQRAKNQLKRVVKNSWTFEDAEYLEKCWLLLADYYIQSGKYDMASDLLAKVTYYNKSSRKAYEYLGYVSEKEQKYKDAAANYELAFKYTGKSNASIGYKLAYAHLKSKNYPDAVDVAQQVIKLNPEYSLRIKKDILDKSMSNLRV
ncbi:tetratricopeptide repeat protein 21B-like [Harmonia axyridis]|uniref:tetratricopeptide repeat protein 21B-like n=1 Tax=Harmonia axyridis TaxID=115357 RepID=UPI001E275FD5|nr:tetratricopeptide repeat protein 21B-like [Harmonia axyridis]XP_045469444.1 tetratricopeptide repeat protein 21B-like [Harmonia axyridis]